MNEVSKASTLYRRIDIPLRSEQLGAKVRPHEYDLVGRACEALRETRSEFIRRVVLDEARRVVAELEAAGAGVEGSPPASVFGGDDV